MASFVHSPRLPQGVRGTVSNGLVAMADWYATFAGLAGIASIEEASPSVESTQESLPEPWGCLEHSPCTFPVDGVDQWGYWIQGSRSSTSPRTELLLGTMGGGALLQGNLKLVLGTQQPDWWYGPHSPNCTNGTGLHAPDTNCAAGCLFDIDRDPGEHTNLRASQGQQYERLLARFHALAPWARPAVNAIFTTPRESNVAEGEAEGAASSAAVCDAMRMRWGGHYGPWNPSR